MQGRFRAQQDTWLGCNGLISLVAATGIALALLTAALIVVIRVVGRIEHAAVTARVTDPRNA